jgi:hypothetical protein
MKEIRLMTLEHGNLMKPHIEYLEVLKDYKD